MYIQLCRQDLFGVPERPYHASVLPKLSMSKSVDLNAHILMPQVFDESGNFIIYPTVLGIKVVNMHSNHLSRLIGKVHLVK